jgi:predicted transglutaminase-like cysteine proteinase
MIAGTASFRRLTVVALIFLVFDFVPAAAEPLLFGYREAPQPGMGFVSHWLVVLDRHRLEDVPEGNCTGGFFNRCHLKEWISFLEGLRNKSRLQQIKEVNRYANEKSYVLDITNYGVEDYWATVKEFLKNDGDCEDYAITKFFSLRWLGFDPEKMRIVVLQDTNLRTAHAVLAVFHDNDVLILDNQSRQVKSHRQLVHYVPLFSVNEKKWWLHLPRS